MQTLRIGGIDIPLYALTDSFDQSYEEVAAIHGLRFMDGSLMPQRAWPRTENYKLRTTINGSGSLPAPLDGLDRGAAQEVRCVAHRSAASPTTTVQFTKKHRTDTGYTPVGFAQVGSLLVPVDLVITEHDTYSSAALSPVSGAQHYQVRYWPQFVGILVHQSSGEPWQAKRSWSVTIEEV